MEESKKQRVALFRFRVIAPLICLKHAERGKREQILRDIRSRDWDIPYSDRSYVGRSTALGWFRAYMAGGQKLESLYPRQRKDKGGMRSMDEETREVLINLKREIGEVGVPTLLKIAKERGVLHRSFRASRQSVYRLFKSCGLEQEMEVKDRRRFEAELPNDLSDCMHGPGVEAGGKKRKTFLFAFIDDHSRLIPHAWFYLRENLSCFLDCFQKALQKRGVPRKLYVDNASNYRSHHMAHVCPSLGIALIHSKPYQAEGRGKIERWFRTVRTKFLLTLPDKLTLEGLNENLAEWIEKEYHLRVHSSTKEKPLERYLEHIKLIRAAPKNLLEYFSLKTTRKVYRDRSVSLDGRVYEAPVVLIERRVSLLYYEEEPDRIEVIYNGQSYGFLVPLNPHVNVKLRRAQSVTEGVDVDLQTPKKSLQQPSRRQKLEAEYKEYKSGKLFENKNKEKESPDA